MAMNVQKQIAKKFVEYWTFQRGSEKGEDQQFWNSLLGEVLGLEDVKSHVQYQVPVPMKGTTKFLDAWIPETRVLIEHKSRGVNLDAPQAGHGGLTPYEQAVEYDNARPFDEKARWIVTCNFDEFRIYDRAKPLAPPLTLKLGNLPKEAYRLAFLVNPKEKAIDRELEISVQAGRIVGEIYDALLKQYQDVGLQTYDDRKPEVLSPKSEVLAALNRLCVRLVFCLYAEDAEIFPKDCFRRLMENTPASFLRERLIRLFQVLDTPPDKRNPYLEPELCAFPYTNGGLFRLAAAGTAAPHMESRHLGGDDDIPPMTEEIRQLLIGASQFDWRDITPTIFGALFESTLNPETRRAGGMVYTSVENIHKVIDPLFLSDLTRLVNEVLGMRTEDERQKTKDLGQRTVGQSSVVSPLSSVLRKKLLALQDEMAALTFLDPACGSGNFLTETYICLRRLENRIIAALQQGQGELDLGISIKVSIAQFLGIEINDFAARVARVALWIAEAQMRRETAEILHREPDYLPLTDYDNILEGNALRMDWGEILTQRRRGAESGEVYVIGNPPFRGLSYRTVDQAADMDFVYKDWKDTNYGKLDYVCAWYKKAVDCVKGARCAFVSTNSICQGECVAAMWEPLFNRAAVEIDFAHLPFRWDNEAFDKAHVHCVIVGFHVVGSDKSVASPKYVPIGEAALSPLHPKLIFDGDRIIRASNIDGYLLDAPNIFIRNRGNPPAGFQKLKQGSKPWDGGNLILSPDEREALVSAYPDCDSFIKQYLGAEDLIKGKIRYCLWLLDVSPARYRNIPEIMHRLAAVAEIRRKTKTVAVQKQADTPYLFSQIRQPDTDYLCVPEVSSEERRYIPIGFLSKDVIAANTVMTMGNATPCLFGMISSKAHTAWVRTVAGRLESRYRYTPSVYNNFPWPDLCDPARLKITTTAQGILNARTAHPDCTLADLYDPLTMPPDLRAAHEANDRAVLAAYGLAPDTPEPEIVAHLFGLYAEAIKKKECK